MNARRGALHGAGGDLHRAMAERRTILRVPAGSTLHGDAVYRGGFACL